METEKFQTIKIWKKTLTKLRLLHAYTGKAMVLIMDELATEALDRIMRDEDKEGV